MTVSRGLASARATSRPGITRCRTAAPDRADRRARMVRSCASFVAMRRKSRSFARALNEISVCSGFQPSLPMIEAAKCGKGQMTGKQGGPGNEPQAPGSQINIHQSLYATITTSMSLLMATQLLMRFALWPDRIKDHAPGTHDRLEFLLQEVLREIKNMLAKGIPKGEEATGKRTALALVNQIAVVLRRELDSDDDH